MHKKSLAAAGNKLLSAKPLRIFSSHHNITNTKSRPAMGGFYFHTREPILAHGHAHCARRGPDLIAPRTPLKPALNRRVPAVGPILPASPAWLHNRPQNRLRSILRYLLAPDRSSSIPAAFPALSSLLHPSPAFPDWMYRPSPDLQKYISRCKQWVSDNGRKRAQCNAGAAAVAFLRMRMNTWRAADDENAVTLWNGGVPGTVPHPFAPDKPPAGISPRIANEQQRRVSQPPHPHGPGPHA